MQQLQHSIKNSSEHLFTYSGIDKNGDGDVTFLEFSTFLRKDFAELVETKLGKKS